MPWPRPTVQLLYRLQVQTRTGGDGECILDEYFDQAFPPEPCPVLHVHAYACLLSRHVLAG